MPSNSKITSVGMIRRAMYIFVVLTKVSSDVLSKTSIECTVGQNITLTCNTTLEPAVQWSHSGDEGAFPHVVFNGAIVLNGYKERFSVDTSVKFEYNLAIRNIRSTDAGLYLCTDDGGLGDEKLFMVSVRSVMAKTSTAAICETTESVVGTNSETTDHDMRGWLMYRDSRDDMVKLHPILIAVIGTVAAVGFVTAVTLVMKKHKSNKPKKAIDDEEYSKEVMLSSGSSVLLIPGADDHLNGGQSVPARGAPAVTEG